MKLPTKIELDHIDMSDIVAKMKPCPELSFLSEPAGMNHYRFFRWLGAVYPGSVISELGTYMGLATMCFADTASNKVITYDVDFSFVKWKEKPKNIELRTAIGFNYFPPEITNSTIIFVDTYHEGIMENAIYKYLIDKKWKGILIYDDIYYNQEMRRFWDSIPEPKINATEIGHVSGTGIIEFI